MKPKTLLIAIAFVLVTGNAWSQHQPYAGMQVRPVKALSTNR